MLKRDLIIQHAATRARLLEALLGISEAGLSQPGAFGDWSARDMLAHLVAWERHAYDQVRLLRARQPLPYSAEAADRNAHNARVTLVWRDKPLRDLVEAATVAHRQLAVALAGCSQAQIELMPAQGNSIGEIVQSLLDHEKEHIAQVLAWRHPTHALDVGPKVLLQHTLDWCRTAFLTLIDAVPAAERSTLPVTGTWTVKDICGHVADWDEMVVQATLAMEANQAITWEPSDYGEAWNQAHAEARREQSWDRVWREFRDVRGTVVTELAERVFEPDLARRLPSPWSGEMSWYVCLCMSCRHDMEHVEPLEQWLAGKG